MTKKVHDHDHYENTTSEDVKTGSFWKIFYFGNPLFALSHVVWYGVQNTYFDCTFFASKK